MIDEDFEEIMKEQTQYIEELEAELAEYKHVASAIDKQWAESQDEIADLKAKLAKAAAQLEETNSVLTQTVGQRRHKAWATIRKTNNTLVELTGGKDE